MGAFTVCSGQSNGGKSAVLRALAALLRNDSVTEYVTHGEKDLAVKVTLHDGHVVLWEKGKTKHQYTLTRPDGTKSLYQKVGTAVPEEVADVLRIVPIVMEDGTKVHLNLHEQQESPFLIMDTAGYVAKVMGELTSAGKLFAAASEGNRRTREEKKVRSLREADILQIAGNPLDPSRPGDLAQYSGLDAAKETIECVMEQAKTARKLTTAIESVEKLSTEWRESGAHLSSCDGAISRLQPVISLDFGTISQLNTAATSLSSLISAHETSTSSLVSLETSIEPLERQAAADLAPLVATNTAVGELSTLADEHASISRAIWELTSEFEVPEVDTGLMLKLHGAQEQLEGLIGAYGAVSDALDTLGDEIFALRDELRVAEDELGEIDTCPTCSQPLGDDARAHLTGTAHA